MNRLREKAATTEGFISLALANPNNAAILQRLGELGLEDIWLVAGCLCQSIWNQLESRSSTEGINDYDIFYFDGDDLSYEAEDRVIRRAGALFSDLEVTVEVRNQARVHLWYEAHFGRQYPQLRSSTDGIDRFPVKGTCVGLTMGNNSPHLYAPYGLDDVAKGILRPNPLLPYPRLFQAKAQSYRERWPSLRIEA